MSCRIRYLRHAPRALLALAMVAVPWLARGQSVAFTFDDGPEMADEAGLSPEARNDAILAQLAQAHLKSILFVTRVDGDKKRNALIRRWGAEGHGIANHTATHPDFNQTSLSAFQKDFLICDAALRDLPGFTRRFRYPYLKEGDTVGKRDGFRAFLDSHGYHPGPVSIDASDWYYSARLKNRLARNPRASTAGYQAAYLRHLLDRAQYYDRLSRTVLDRSVLHVLLLHHNLINALFLRDVIAMFRQNGWTVIDAEQAFADPVYARKPAIIPAGESILWALAKEKGVPGLRYPAEDEVYEKPTLDRLVP